MGSQFQLKLPIIRKVFRQGDFYTCSLCRTKHKAERDAVVCLNQCWFDIHRFDPVVLRRKGFRKYVYRCHFCCRDYESDQLARHCAKRCLNSGNRLHIQEQLLVDEPLPPPQSTVSRMIDQYNDFMRQQAEAAAAAEAAAKRARREVVEIKREKPMAEVVVYRGKHKNSFNKKSDRKNEKYYCNYCKVLHYTRMEADNCFETHFLEDGFEKIPTEKMV